MPIDSVVVVDREADFKSYYALFGYTAIDTSGSSVILGNA